MDVLEKSGRPDEGVFVGAVGGSQLVAPPDVVLLDDLSSTRAIASSLRNLPPYIALEPKSALAIATVDPLEVRTRFAFRWTPL